jgi:hypothetical protein
MLVAYGQAPGGHVTLLASDRRRCRSSSKSETDERPETRTDVAALAVHLMINTAVTGATYDIDRGQQFVA